MSFPASNLEAAAFLGVVVAYLVQSFVSIDELTLRTTLWTGLAGLAVVVPATKAGKKKSVSPASRSARRSRTAPTRPLRLWPAVVAVGALALLTISWPIRFVAADARVNWGSQLLSNGLTSEGISQFEGALDFRDDVSYRVLLAGTLANQAVKTGSQELFEEADRAYRGLADWPDVQVVVAHARLLRGWSEIEPAHLSEAIAMFRTAMELDERNPFIRIELSDLLVGTGKADEALSILEPFIGEFRRFDEESSDLWGAIALARIEEGDEAGAREAVALALQDDPDDPRAHAALELLK
jgi:tetratricopeptide (TPR) repeat protein